VYLLITGVQLINVKYGLFTTVTGYNALKTTPEIIPERKSPEVTPWVG